MQTYNFLNSCNEMYMDIQKLSETDLTNVLKQELCVLTNKVLIRLTKLIINWISIFKMSRNNFPLTYITFSKSIKKDQIFVITYDKRESIYYMYL